MTSTKSIHLVVPVAMVLVAVAAFVMFWHTMEQTAARTADYCRSHGMIGYTLGKYTGPSCIDPSGAYVDVPRKVLQ